MNDKIYSLDDEIVKLRKQYLDEYKYYHDLYITVGSDDANNRSWFSNNRSWFRLYLTEKCNDAIRNLRQLETSFKKEYEEDLHMNLLEAFKKIKSDHAGKQCLITRFQGPREDNVQVCIKVEDNFIVLSAFPITVDDMLAGDWELLVSYKMGNSYEEVEQ